MGSFKKQAELNRQRREREAAQRQLEKEAEAFAHVFDPPESLYPLLREHFGEPELIPHVPWRIAEMERCHENVFGYTSKYGGSVVTGFKMLSNDHEVTGEIHSVWCDEKGALTDITPRSAHHRSSAKTTVFVRIPGVELIAPVSGGRVAFNDHPVLQAYRSLEGGS